MKIYNSEQVPSARESWESALYKGTVIIRAAHRSLGIPQPRQYKARKKKGLETPPVLGEENSYEYENTISFVEDLNA